MQSPRPPPSWHFLLVSLASAWAEGPLELQPPLVWHLVTPLSHSSPRLGGEDQERCFS